MPKSPNRFHMRSSPSSLHDSNVFCHRQQTSLFPFHGALPTVGEGRFTPSTPRKVSFEDGNRSDSDASLPARGMAATSSSFGPFYHHSHHERSANSITVQSRRQDREEDEPLRQSPACNNEGRSNTTTSLSRRKRPALVRPTTSLSLVDLANQMSDDGNDNETSAVRHSLDSCYHNSDDDEDCNHEGRRAAKRLYSPQPSPHCSLSFPLSSSPSSSNHHTHPPLALGSRSSPWGHFVDTVPEDEEALVLVSPPPTGTSTPRPYFFADHDMDIVGDDATRGNHYLSPPASSSITSHHDNSCYCCTSCRIRRASPYNKTSIRRRKDNIAGIAVGTTTTAPADQQSSPPPPPSLTFLQLQESFRIPSSSAAAAAAAALEGAPRFRLTPRKPTRGDNGDSNSSNNIDLSLGDSSHHHTADGCMEPTKQLIGAFSLLQVRNHNQQE